MLKNPALFSTGSLYLDEVSVCFALAAQAGFDGMEILVDNRWSTRNPVSLKRLSQQHQLPIQAVHNPFAYNVVDWPSSAQPVNVLEKTVQLAQELNAQVVVLHLPVVLSRSALIQQHKSSSILGGKNPEKSLKHWIEQGGIRQLEASSGIAICVENMPKRTFLWWKNLYHWNNIRQWPLVHDTLTLDTTHWGTWGMEPVEVFRTVRSQVRHIHLSNFDGDEHQLPTNGFLDLASLLKEVSQTEHPISVTLELSPKAILYQDEVQRAEALQTSIDFIRKNLR